MDVPFTYWLLIGGLLVVYPIVFQALAVWQEQNPHPNAPWRPGEQTLQCHTPLGGVEEPP